MHPDSRNGRTYDHYGECNHEASAKKLALLVAEREIEMYSRGGGVGIVGVIIIVLVILWLAHVI
jgi:hypothetical protein